MSKAENTETVVRHSILVPFGWRDRLRVLCGMTLCVTIRTSFVDRLPASSTPVEVKAALLRPAAAKAVHDEMQDGHEVFSFLTTSI